MSEKLLPCPFCGSDADVFHNTTSDYESQWDYDINCTNEDDCNASIVCWKDKNKAIQAWNKRAKIN